MNRKKLEEFISNNDDEILINDNIDKNKIHEIEKTLENDLPNDYKWFLQKCGFLMGYGIEIFGIGKSEEPTVIKETLRYRKLGLPNNLIVIQNCNEWVHCLNLSKSSNIECCIFSWDIVMKTCNLKAEDFLSYLLQILNEGKELWEEE